MCVGVRLKDKAELIYADASQRGCPLWGCVVGNIGERSEKETLSCTSWCFRGHCVRHVCGEGSGKSSDGTLAAVPAVAPDAMIPAAEWEGTLSASTWPYVC